MLGFVEERLSREFSRSHMSLSVQVSPIVTHGEAGQKKWYHYHVLGDWIQNNYL